MECRVCIDFSWVIHRSYHAHRTLSANIDGKEVGTGDILFKKRTQNRILGVTHVGMWKWGGSPQYMSIACGADAWT
jgi:hypothetical protein